METKDLDRIEKYLSGKMTSEENKRFEKELGVSKDLANQTKKIAYIIYSINVVGLKRDNERIKRMHASVSGDYKRFMVSIAAMLAVVLVFATVVSVPVYQYVVKPIIKKVFHSAPSPKHKLDVVPLDTISLSIVDTLNIDTMSVPSTQPQKNEEPKIKLKATPKEETKEEPKVIEEKLETIVPTKVDTIIPVVVQKVLPSDPPKPANRIVSYSLLENYEFGIVSARRKGSNVVCSFTMRNVKENAKIQMHSARAKDGDGKSYLAKNCLLNGQNKRIIEKWKKDEEHLVEITIENVPTEMTEFESISFSFQSEGDGLTQKSQSIVLKVGEIL